MHWLLTSLTFFGLIASPVLPAEEQPHPLPDAPSAVLAKSEGRSAPSSSTLVPQSSSSSSDIKDDQTTGNLGYWAARGLADQRDIYGAPFHRSAVKWDLIFLGVTGALLATDENTAGALPRSHLNISTDVSNVGLFATTGTVGALLLDGLVQDHPHAREAGIVGLESLANSAALYAALQLVVGRSRPLQNSGEGLFWRKEGLSNSFPSGHAIISWTAASVVAHEYPKPWVEWLAYGAAGAVSVGRVTSLQHFPADVFVAGTFGYLIGRHVFHAHCKPGLSDACHLK